MRETAPRSAEYDGALTRCVRTMRPGWLLRPLLILAAFGVATPARAEEASPAEAMPELAMTSPDHGRAIYADRCSNGSHLEDGNRDRFIQRMLDDPRSTLARKLATLTRRYPANRSDPIAEPMLGAWSLSYAARIGCRTIMTSYSAFVQMVEGEGERSTVTMFLVTIDDDFDGAERTLRLRSIAPIAIRGAIRPFSSR